MKKLISMLLIAATALSLCACGGTAQSAVSEESIAQAEPEDPCQTNGHDFAPATCLEPRSCKVCGETQGEAQGHIYGHWQLGDADMSRVCKVCNESESRELDYQFVVEQELPGLWEFEQMLITEGGQEILVPAHEFSVNGYEAHMQINADGSAEKLVDSSWNEGPVMDIDYDNMPYTTTASGSKIYDYSDPDKIPWIQVDYRNGAKWSYLDCEKSEDGSLIFHVDIAVQDAPEDGTQVELRYADGKYRLIYPLGGGQTAILSREHGETYANLIVGEWTDGYYTYVFHEDRTVDYGMADDVLWESNWNWLMRPVHDGELEVVLVYGEASGDPESFCTFHGFEADGSTSSRDSLYVEAYYYVGGRGYVLEGPLYPDDGDKQTYFAPLARKVLSDVEWTSTELRTVDATSGQTMMMKTDEYSLSFTTEQNWVGEPLNMDVEGRFTATLDEEISGYWTVEEAILGEYNRAEITCHLYPDGYDGSQPYYIASFNHSPTDADTGGISLELSEASEEGEESGSSYIMQVISQEDAEWLKALEEASPALLAGEWTAFSCQRFENGRWESVDSYAGDSFRFTEDGQFSGTLMGDEVSGEWFCSEVRIVETSTYSVVYVLQSSEPAGAYMSVQLQVDGEVPQEYLNLSYNTEGKTIHFTLKRSDEAQ